MLGDPFGEPFGDAELDDEAEVTADFSLYDFDRHSVPETLSSGSLKP